MLTAVWWLSGGRRKGKVTTIVKFRGGARYVTDNELAICEDSDLLGEGVLSTLANILRARGIAVTLVSSDGPLGWGCWIERDRTKAYVSVGSLHVDPDQEPPDYEWLLTLLESDGDPRPPSFRGDFASALEETDDIRDVRWEASEIA